MSNVFSSSNRWVVWDRLDLIVGPNPGLRVSDRRFCLLFVNSTDPALNGHLRYPNHLDQSLNDTTTDKIRTYRVDYNNTISPLMTPLLIKYVHIVFLQTHRETDRFFAVSGVLSAQSDRGFFHYLRATFSSMIKCLSYEVSHSPLTLTNFSYINLVFVFRCSSSTTIPVSVSRVNSSFLVFSLSSHRYSYISLLFSSRFIDS